AESGQTQQLKTQQIETQEMPAAAAARAQPAESTQMIDTAAASTAPVDFDLTGQFESQTVQINLDADDPVSEADFHLAYGLYDEAALLLKQAAEKEPDRNEIRIKLAETYFAAGKRAEFEDTARALRPKLSAGEWQKIAIMGQQLAPDSPLFVDTAPSADVAPGDLDLDLGAGEAPAAKEPQEASAALDFSLDELEAPRLDEPQIELAADRGEALEFDLTQFDLASPSPPQAPAAEKKAESKDESLLDFDLDLSGFDSGEPPAPAPQATAQPESEPPETPETPELAQAPEPLDVPAPSEAEAEAEAETPGPQEIRLDDIDLGDVSIEGDASASDEAATKLDLARAYVDMGDNEMARSLLEEVAQQGNAEQKKDARKLIEELG
ncbi:MAG: FimV/HubP family polar landmark protein, partial [Pseudomonadota bacterium]